MENCKDCIFYDVEYDSLIQSGLDIITESTDDKHFCRMYKDGIPKDIWDNKIKCKENPII